MIAIIEFAQQILVLIERQEDILDAVDGIELHAADDARVAVARFKQQTELFGQAAFAWERGQDEDL